MKKFLFVFACLFIFLTLASCGSKSPEQQAVQIIEKTTARIEKAQTADDLKQISRDYQKELGALLEKYPALKETGEDDPAIKEAINRLIDVSTAAEDRFGGDAW